MNTVVIPKSVQIEEGDNPRLILKSPELVLKLIQSTELTRESIAKSLKLPVVKILDIEIDPNGLLILAGDQYVTAAKSAMKLETSNGICVLVG